MEAIQDSVGHMQRLVRDILGRLRPADLIELGLAAAIGELVAFWRARHPAIDFVVSVPDDATSMPDPVRETLYRVVQEGLNNAVRHGHPSRVEIEVSRGLDGHFTARITDDGSASDTLGKTGFGLIGMRERVAAAQGRLSIIQGAEKGGWTILARLPDLDNGEGLSEGAA
jgi:two-component system sensor histidine kinase UhpB